MNKLIPSILLLSIHFVALSQELEYAKHVVATLASDAYYGRGYVSAGEGLAAQFIAEEFDRIGLKEIDSGYFQHFNIDVNTFPASMNLSLDGRLLRPGIDYLIEPGSPGINGTFKVVTLSIAQILDQSKLPSVLQKTTGKFVVVPSYQKEDYSAQDLKRIHEVVQFLKFHPENPAAGTIIFTHEKLTWSGSTQQYSRPTFTILDSAIQPTKKITVDVDAKFISNYRTQNVVGMIEGTQPDTVVLLVGHYDHLGMMGENALFPGANDNASGIAMLLSLANYYQEHKPKYSMVFIAFGAEEVGLLGAHYFVEHPLVDLAKIKFLLNFDISGTGDDGIKVVNGKIHQREFDQLVELNNRYELLKQVRIRGEACNSDHCMFHMKGVPCFFIYTLGGIQAYHDVYDKAETLPLTAFENYFTLITHFIDSL